MRVIKVVVFILYICIAVSLMHDLVTFKINTAFSTVTNL